MLIIGEWQLCDDGITRPTVRAKVLGSDGSLVAEDFLLDSGADRTVLSAAVLARLQLPVSSALLALRSVALEAQVSVSW